jgi:Zn-dependent protease with chaperone function
MKTAHISNKDLAIDMGLMIGTILAIFAFGLVALPYFPVN